jgi:tRNA-specific 2-thiouridylase
MEIAALASGGVDSSVVIYQLKELGYSPIIFYIQIGMNNKKGDVDCYSEEDIEIISSIAKMYGCRLEIVSLHEEYWEIIVGYIIASVKEGLTPNPDIMCNKFVKFGIFEQKWGRNFSKIATGHYATTTKINDKIYLSTAIDRIKDQTYFLGQIDLQISKLMFPIGCLHKYEVREIALKQKLPSAFRKDSYGICFLGKINYNDFIRRYFGEKFGRIVEFETGKILGNHNGYWFYTIGQRKGLYLSGGPWFVIKKNIQQNIIFVSNACNLEKQSNNIINLHSFHFIAGIVNAFNEMRKIAFKIRHTPEFEFGKIECIGDVYKVESKRKIYGIAPGQFCVVYDENCKLCIGSGVII